MSELFSSLPTLCCGFGFTICINENGNVYSFGKNSVGACAHDLNIEIIFPPRQINNLNNIQFICCGSDHTLCCNYDGNVFSFGDNYYGQLGLNKSFQELKHSYIPQQINLPLIQQISCGFNFSLCLSIDGELWSFGENCYGELGNGNTMNSFKPLKINNLSNIDYIACGGCFSFCKSSSNDIYSWGQNNYGQLALGHTDTITLPRLCKNIPDNITSIRAGACHSLLLTSTGIVYSCGDSDYGQLGHGNLTKLSIPKKILSLPFIKKISCGYSHSVCIDSDGNLWVFGCNEYGQLGLGHTDNMNIPIKHELLSNIIDISYNSYSTIIKTLDNKIYAFGFNDFYQIGIKTMNKVITKPMQTLIEQEDIWQTNISKSRAKSARK